MALEHLELWGEKMEILHSENIRLQENDFPLHEVSASDDTRAVLLICSERVSSATEEISTVIERILKKLKLRPTFRNSNNHLFLESVSPLDIEISKRFNGKQIGLIALINGQEPGNGAHALDQMSLHEGDSLDVLYRVGDSDLYDINCENGVTGRD